MMPPPTRYSRTKTSTLRALRDGFMREWAISVTAWVRSSQLEEASRDAQCRIALAVRRAVERPRAARLPLDLLEGRENALARGAADAVRAARHGFDPLGLLAQREARRADEERLLLHAA